VCLPPEIRSRVLAETSSQFYSGISKISVMPPVADRIHRELALLLNDGYEVFSTASVGICECNGYDQPEDLRDADTAMYHAKALGKARYGGVRHSHARQHKGTLAVGRTCGGLLSARSFGFITSRLCRCKATKLAGSSACAGSIHSVASFSRRVHCSGGRNWTDRSHWSMGSLHAVRCANGMQDFLNPTFED